MKTFKQLAEELYINDLIELSTIFSGFSEEDINELVSEGFLTEEEGLFLMEVTKSETRKNVGGVIDTIGDTAAGYARGLVGRERFNRWGGSIRSKIFGTSPEDEEKKLQKDYDIRSKRSPAALGRGEKTGEVVRKVGVPIATGIGVTKVLKPVVGAVPAIIAGGVASGAASAAAEKNQPSSDKPENKIDTKPDNKPAELPTKPETKVDTKPPESVKPSGDAVRMDTIKPDDLERSKELIKKREEAKSPVYKIGDVAGKLFGGGKEGESGVADTYRRLQKDPKAASEFLKIQQQRNKDMGL